jgi:hypothetical protein
MSLFFKIKPVFGNFSQLQSVPISTSTNGANGISSMCMLPLRSICCDRVGITPSRTISMSQIRQIVWSVSVSTSSRKHYIKGKR